MDKLQELDEALEICVQAVLEQGLSLEQALARYPHLIEELRPRLDTALWLHQRRQVLSAQQWQISRGRRELEQRILQQRHDWSGHWRRLRLAQRAFQGIVLLLLALVFTRFNLKVAYAASISLPGDPLYPLKLVQEKTRLALTFDRTEDARLYVAIARERSNELQALVLEGRFSYLAPTSANLGKSFLRAQAVINQVSQAQSQQALEQELNSTLESQQAVMSILSSMIPAEVRADIIPLPGAEK